MQMALSDKLLSFILSGLILWAIQQGISHHNETVAMEAGLLAEINDAASSTTETTEAAKVALDRHIKAGAVLDIGADYYSWEFGYYNANLRDLPAHLSGNELAKVVRYYRAMQEFQHVSNTFFSRMRYYENSHELISEGSAVMFQRNYDRLESLSKILAAKEYTELSQLPGDYMGRAAPAKTIK